MEKLKKSYVEKRYKEKAEISEVMERDPMKIQNDGEICAFRFFDKEINANGEEKYDGEKSNFSKMLKNRIRKRSKQIASILTAFSGCGTRI